MESRPRRPTKKRKKKFISKQIHQAKRGRYGRGSEIGEDNFNYFLHVLQVKMDDFSNSEDKEIFIDNVFEQTAGKEMLISCNQLGSVAMERFLPLTNDKILLRFTYAFSRDLRKMCTDEFGSHVLQQLLAVVTSLVQKNGPSVGEQGIGNNNCNDEDKNINEDNPESQCTSPEMIMRFKNWLDQVSKYILNNFEEFVVHRYANYIVRTVLECLSGLPVGYASKTNKQVTNCTQVISPSPTSSPIAGAHDIIRECGKRIYKMPQLAEFPYETYTSILLQTILYSLREIDETLVDKLMKHLLNKCYDPTLEDFKQNVELKDNEPIADCFMCESACRLMDVMINVTSDMWFSQIYIRCFKNRLKVLSVAPYVNYCVQNLIRRCPEKSEFEEMFEELSPCFEDLANNKKHGVLLAVAQACQRLGTLQLQFVKELQKAMHCAEPEERRGSFPLLVAHMVNYEMWDDWKQQDHVDETKQGFQVSLHGTLMLETMLNYPVASKVVKCLLSMETKSLELLLCDRRGSHIADAYFASKTVTEKNREKMFVKLKSSFIALVLSQHGSRALDAIWLWASLKHRKLILEELSSHEAVIRSKLWGAIFSDKSGLSLFKRRPKDWEDVQTRDVRKQQLFADIIN